LYLLFFDGVKIQIAKGEEIIYTAKLGLGSGVSTNETIGWQSTALKKKTQKHQYLSLAQM